MGFRVPGVIVSPYARSKRKRGRYRVDHGKFGHESILKLISHRFGLGYLNKRHRYAANIGHALDWEFPDFESPSFPTRPRSRRPRASSEAATCRTPSRRTPATSTRWRSWPTATASPYTKRHPTRSSPGPTRRAGRPTGAAEPARTFARVGRTHSLCDDSPTMFGGGGSIQLARVFGIRVGVTTSWFVVLFVFIFLLSGSFRDTLDSSDTTAYATAVASVLLFFVSLLAHELGHALVARRVGVEILGIDLWFFGGIAKMDRDPDTPGAEFKIAVAGPVVSLAVVALCAGLGTLLVGWNEFLDAALLRTGVDVTPGLLLLSWLASINAAVFVFNLLPAFPLDGGRIARAVVWQVTGDRLKATRAAATLGQGLAYILIGFGLYLALLSSAAFSGLWLAVLGWFLLQAARGAVAQTVFSERLEGVTVADIMDSEPVSIPASIPVTQALDEYFLRYRWPWFPVVDEAGRFVGIVHEERVQGAERLGDGAQAVRELMDADDGEWQGRRRRDAGDAAGLRAAAQGRRAVRGRPRRPPARRGDDRPGPPGAAERRRPRRLMGDPRPRARRGRRGGRSWPPRGPGVPGRARRRARCGHRRRRGGRGLGAGVAARAGRRRAGRPARAGRRRACRRPSARPDPRMFHFVTGGVTPAALGADWLATPSTRTLRLGQLPAASRLEAGRGRLAQGPLRAARGWGGVLTTGATMANFTGAGGRAQLVGRAARASTSTSAGWPGCPPVPVLTGGYMHASAGKALHARPRPRGRRAFAPRRRRPARPRRAGARARRAGRRAGDLVANAGEVNAGDFDPIDGAGRPRRAARRLAARRRRLRPVRAA